MNKNKDEKTHFVTICEIYNKDLIIGGLNIKSIFTKELKTLLGVFSILIITMFITSIYIAYTMSKKLFLPLRKLNFKLNTIIQEGMNRELT